MRFPHAPENERNLEADDSSTCSTAWRLHVECLISVEERFQSSFDTFQIALQIHNHLSLRTVEKCNQSVLVALLPLQSEIKIDLVVGEE
jgi:hypothetical protein